MKCKGGGVTSVNCKKVGAHYSAPVCAMSKISLHVKFLFTREQAQDEGSSSLFEYIL